MMTEMINLVMLQILRDTVTIVGVVSAFAYYALIVRGNKKARQIEMFMRVYQTSTDPENYKQFWDLIKESWKDLEDYLEKYGPHTNPDGAAERISHWSIYEGLGVLVKDKIFDLNIVYNFLGFRIIMIWYKFETVIKELRKMAGGPGPDYMENFEWLANEMIKKREQKGLPKLQYTLQWLMSKQSYGSVELDPLLSLEESFLKEKELT